MGNTSSSNKNSFSIYWQQYAPSTTIITDMINIFSNSISNLIEENKEDKISLNELLVEEIISFNFHELPIYTLRIKEKDNDELQTYSARITNYPNYLLKNNKNISKYAIKKIKVDSMSWVYYTEKERYDIIDKNDDHFTIYSDRLYKKI